MSATNTGNLVPAGEEHVEKEPKDEDRVRDVLHPVDLLREVDVRDAAQLACILHIKRICFLSEKLTVHRTHMRHSKAILPVFQICIHFIRICIRIQHFRLNTDPDPGF